MKNREESTELQLDFTKRGGLLVAVAQDATTKDILMVGFINQAAWAKTLATGLATFWSTSRNSLWTKGETSGDFLKIRQILVDCDQDAVVYQVDVQGAGACHTKAQTGLARRSCFYRAVQANSLHFLEK